MAFWPLRFAGGVLTGIGFFQLYDGLIQRKLLGLRQIRYEVDLAPYDLTWNIVAAVLLMIGVAVIIRTFGEIVLCEAHFDELEAEYCQNCTRLVAGTRGGRGTATGRRRIDDESDHSTRYVTIKELAKLLDDDQPHLPRTEP